MALAIVMAFFFVATVVVTSLIFGFGIIVKVSNCESPMQGGMGNPKDEDCRRILSCLKGILLVHYRLCLIDPPHNLLTPLMLSPV